MAEIICSSANSISCFAQFARQYIHYQHLPNNVCVVAAIYNDVLWLRYGEYHCSMSFFRRNILMANPTIRLKLCDIMETHVHFWLAFASDVLLESNSRDKLWISECGKSWFYLVVLQVKYTSFFLYIYTKAICVLNASLHQLCMQCFISKIIVNR